MSLLQLSGYLHSYLILATPYMATGALLIALIAVGYAIALKHRLMRLSAGKSGNLEETLEALLKDSKDNKQFRAELERYLKLAESRLRQSVQGVGVVRFNPFAEGQGGNQSFCVAFLDEQGSGVVFSTLYARDRVGVYAKPVSNGSSSFELSAEEKEAIAKAQESIIRARKK